MMMLLSKLDAPVCIDVQRVVRRSVMLLKALTSQPPQIHRQPVMQRLSVGFGCIHDMRRASST